MRKHDQGSAAAEGARRATGSAPERDRKGRFSARRKRALQAAGATLWYWPPYSPDLHPIELCFAKLQALVRTARCRRSETLWPFLGTCLEHFSPDECRNYFRHCGYSVATRS